MSLPALPPELIALILKEAMPEGFEPLMLTCKRVYGSGESLLTRHNTLRRKYSNIVVDGQQNLASIPLLLQIARDPLIAAYVEDVDLWNEADLPLSINLLDEQTISNTDFSSELQPLIARLVSTYTLELNDDKWLEKIRAEVLRKTAFLCSLTLIAMLPNLRRLTSCSEWSPFFETNSDGEREAPYWRMLMDTLVASANGSDRSTKPFSSLALVRPCSPCGYDSSMSLEQMSPFMALPTVTDMSLSSCKAVNDGYTGNTFKWQYPFESNIRQLELAHCCMSGAELGKALQHMPQLRTLRYSHATKWHGCMQEWDSGAFIAHVGKWCGAFLIELSVTMPQIFGETDGAAPFLKQFVTLELLELDVRSLNLHQALEEDVFDDEPPPTPTMSPTRELSDANSVYSLADILPNAIKSLRLITSGSDKDYELMQRLLDRGNTRPFEGLEKLDRFEMCRAADSQDNFAFRNGDSRWTSLGQALPSSIEYSFSVTDSDGPAWHAKFFERYPYVRE